MEKNVLHFYSQSMFTGTIGSSRNSWTWLWLGHITSTPLQLWHARNTDGSRLSSKSTKSMRTGCYMTLDPLHFWFGRGGEEKWDMATGFCSTRVRGPLKLHFKKSTIMGHGIVIFRLAAFRPLVSEGTVAKARSSNEDRIRRMFSLSVTKYKHFL